LGSLKVGKDADLVIKGGTLLEVTAPVDMVLVGGRIAFEREGSGIAVKKPAAVPPAAPPDKKDGTGTAAGGGAGRGPAPAPAPATGQDGGARAREEL